jgi:hypothetical protein
MQRSASAAPQAQVDPLRAEPNVAQRFLRYRRSVFCAVQSSAAASRAGHDYDPVAVAHDCWPGTPDGWHLTETTRLAFSRHAQSEWK